MKSGTFFTYETYNDDLFFTLAHTAAKLLGKHYLATHTLQTIIHAQISLRTHAHCP